MKKNTLKIEVELNAKKIPTNIIWTGPDGLPHDTKGILISYIEKNSRDTMKLDLWTEDLQVGEMDLLMYYTFKTLADTYINATGNKDLAEKMRQFAHFFGLETKIIESKK